MLGKMSHLDRQWLDAPSKANLSWLSTSKDTHNTSLAIPGHGQHVVGKFLGLLMRMT